MEIIPDRAEFKRADVEKITSLSGKVLDYWEEEFGSFFPKNENGYKTYSRKDVIVILKIKQYLTVDRLNKAEIKEKLSKNINLESEKTVSKTFIKKDLIKPKTDSKKKGLPNPIDQSPFVKKTQKKNYTDSPENKNNGNKNELKQLKEDLQDILTILKNNDKNK